MWGMWNRNCQVLSNLAFFFWSRRSKRPPTPEQQKMMIAEYIVHILIRWIQKGRPGQAAASTSSRCAMTASTFTFSYQKQRRLKFADHKRHKTEAKNWGEPPRTSLWHFSLALRFYLISFVIPPPWHPSIHPSSPLVTILFSTFCCSAICSVDYVVIHLKLSLYLNVFTQNAPGPATGFLMRIPSSPVVLCFISLVLDAVRSERTMGTKPNNCTRFDPDDCLFHNEWMSIYIWEHCPIVITTHPREYAENTEKLQLHLSSCSFLGGGFKAFNWLFSGLSRAINSTLDAKLCTSLPAEKRSKENWKVFRISMAARTTTIRRLTSN